MKKSSTSPLPAFMFPLSFSAFFIIVALTFFTSSPPIVKGILTKPTDFSAKNAQIIIKELTEMGPREVTSSPGIEKDSHKQAREYILDRLQQLGLSSQVQTEKICRGYHDSLSGMKHCFLIHNIVGKREGTTTKPALMLVAHYDSAHTSPGAADDAAGIATILEIVRILKLQEKPARPLIVLITDGEEAGLLGAQVFVRSHPFAKEVGVVLNFEARGTQGQVAMFETSTGNQWLLDLYAKSVSRPASSSTIATLYQLLPNTTDLRVFLKTGMQGLNFAFADGEWNYHTKNDHPSHLDLRSVQDMGDQGLAVAKAFIQISTFPPNSQKPNGVWFDLFTLTLISYSVTFAQELAIIQVILAFVAFGISIFQKQLSLPFLLRHGLQTVLRFLAGTCVTFLLALALQKWRPSLPFSFVSIIPMWTILFAVVVIALSLLVFMWNRKNRDFRHPFSANVLIWTLLSLGTSFFLPGVSYLFTWPALFSSIGLFLFLRKRQTLFISWLALHLGFLSAALLWVPMVRILIIMAGYHLPSIGLLPLFFLGSFTSAVQKAWATPICIFIGMLSLMACFISVCLSFWH